MTSLRLLLLVIISVTGNESNSDDNAVNIDSQSNDINLLPEISKSKILKNKLNDTKDIKLSDELTMNHKYTKLLRKNRIHKAYYSQIPQIFNKYHNNKKKHQESDIYYVRLPPSPYFYVPGLGYISNPPSFSTSSLRPQINYSRPHHQANQQKPTPFINVPVDFISNGKPVHVYQWENSRKTSKRPLTSSTITKLKKGPYSFNGKPSSLYLLNNNGQISNRQKIIHSNNLY